MNVPQIDPVAIRSHVEMLHGLAEGASVDGVLTFSRAETTRDGMFTERFAVGDVDRMVEAIVGWASNPNLNIWAPWAVFRKSMPRDSKGGEEHVIASLAFVGDLDADTGKSGNGLPLPSPYVLETSAGNAQPVFPLARALPVNEAKPIAVALADAIGCDSRTKDTSGVWRIPGTLNWPTKKKLERGRSSLPQLVRIQRAWTGELIEPEKIVEAVAAYVKPKQEHQQSASRNVEGFVDLPAGLKKQIASPPYPGEDQSQTAASVFVQLFRRGWLNEQIVAVVEAYPGGIGKRYAEGKELAADVGRTRAKFDQADQKTASPRPQQPVEIFWHGQNYNREARRWLVHELIPEEGSGLESGQWGMAKTFVAMDLSASVMTGTPFAGREVIRRGGILFVAAEGASEIPIRLKGVVEQKLRPNALAAGAAGEPQSIDLDRLPFAWIEECPSLKEDAGLDRLVALAKNAAARIKEQFDLPLALIVLDTVSATGNFSDANDAAEGQRYMGKLNALSRQTGAFALAVDHFGKAVETGTRGTSAKEAAADVVLALLGDRDIAGAISNTRLAVRKLRGGATGAEVPFDLKVVETAPGESTCVIEWKADAPPKAAKTSAKERWPRSLRIFRSALTTALVDHGKLIQPYAGDGPVVRGVPDTLVRQEFMAAYPAEAREGKSKGDAKRMAFTRSIKMARERELICSREIGGIDHLWLVELNGNNSNTTANEHDTP